MVPAPRGKQVSTASYRGFSEVYERILVPEGTPGSKPFGLNLNYMDVYAPRDRDYTGDGHLESTADAFEYVIPGLTNTYTVFSSGFFAGRVSDLRVNHPSFNERIGNYAGAGRGLATAIFFHGEEGTTDPTSGNVYTDSLFNPTPGGGESSSWNPNPHLGEGINIGADEPPYSRSPTEYIKVDAEARTYSAKSYPIDFDGESYDPDLGTLLLDGQHGFPVVYPYMEATVDWWFDYQGLDGTIKIVNGYKLTRRHVTNQTTTQYPTTSCPWPCRANMTQVHAISVAADGLSSTLTRIDNVELEDGITYFDTSANAQITRINVVRTVAGAITGTYATSPFESNGQDYPYVGLIALTSDGYAFALWGLEWKGAGNNFATLTERINAYKRPRVFQVGNITTAGDYDGTGFTSDTHRMATSAFAWEGGYRMLRNKGDFSGNDDSGLNQGLYENVTYATFGTDVADVQGKMEAAVAAGKID